MRRMALAAVMLAVMLGSAAHVEAATLIVNLVGDDSKEIDIDTPVAPFEFTLLDTSWGRVTYQGGLVAYFVHNREDLINAGSLLPTNYPNPAYSLHIRTIGSPAELLVLHGAARPLADGGGAFGGVTVATGPLAFLRNARWTLSAGVLTFTY
jgi:hypothetical protein